MGVQGKAPIVRGLSAVGRAELGLNLVNQNPSYVAGRDGSIRIGEGDNAVTTRVFALGLNYGW